MAETGIQWGATSGHMQVGINVRYDDISSGTTSVNIYVDFYVRSIAWGYSDGQVLSYGGYFGGSTAYTLSTPANSTTALLVSTQSIGGVATSYSGGPSYTFSASVSGAYDGSVPSQSVGFTLPARPASAPSAPVSSSSGITSTSAVVNCTAPSNNGSAIDDYEIQVDDNSDFTSPVGTYNPGDTVSPLSPGVLYYERSRAHNGVGWSTWSTVVNFTTSAAVPNAPSLPSVSSIANTTATAAWTAPASNGSALTGYGWKVCSDSGGVTTVASGSTTTALSAAITGLTPNTDYWVFVRASNGVGWSAYSAGKLFRTSATVATAPTAVTPSAITQTGVSLAWTAPSSDGGSAVTRYDIQLATNNVFSQNVVNRQTLSNVLSLAGIVGLYSGLVWYVRVRAVNAAGDGAWSTAVNFSTLDGTPAIVTPSNGAVSSALGYLSATYSSVGLYGASRLDVEVSKGAETYTRSLDIAAVSGDNQYTVTDNSLYLGVGTWNIRARVYNEDQADYTVWSPTTTMLQSHTPTAQVVSPIGGQVLKYQAVTPLVLGFVDPAGSYDKITAYQFVLEVASSGVVIYDSTKTAIAGAYGNSQVNTTVAIAVGYKNIQLRWRAKVWDNSDTPSAWTGYSLFTPAAEPNITISAPATGSTVLTGAPTLTWSSVFSLGATQASATAVITTSPGGQVVFSQSVVGAIFSVTPGSVVLTNTSSYVLTVTVTDSNGIVGVKTSNFSTSYASPNSIAYEIDPSGINDSGFVNVSWLSATPDGTFSSWKVYRRLFGSSSWELLASISNVNTREYRDYLVLAGTSYIYSVTQVAVRSLAYVESPVGYRDDGGTPTVENRAMVPSITSYWIVDSVDNTQSIKLPGVVSDNSTLEFEDASYTIIGRGRHVDYGDELGYSGTLESHIRNPETTSSVRTAVEELRRRRRTYYLRTPGGRLFKVALGDVTWNPLAGAGTFDMGDLSIPYLEVK